MKKAIIALVLGSLLGACYHLGGQRELNRDVPIPELLPANSASAMYGEFEGFPITHRGDGWFSCLLPDGMFLTCSEGADKPLIADRPNPKNLN